MPSRRLPAPEVCPVCGEDVPRNALACRHCGADHHSGWRADADVYDGTDVPDDAFDYDEFVRQEFGPASRRSALPRSGPHPVWLLTAVLLFIVFLVIYFRPFF